MSQNDSYKDTVIDMLVDCQLFNHFSPADLQQAAPYFHFEDVSKGGKIFDEGDVGTFMGIIHDGKIAVLKTDSQNQPNKLAVLQRGKTFGEMAVLDGERRSASCVAETDCTLLTLSRESLDRMLEEHPKVAAKVVRALAVSLSRRLRMIDFKVADHQI
ncbi:cyclic nucleotide-binding domain-containing protein [Marinobacteraceae bacterium S3BR75-40.1]